MNLYSVNNYIFYPQWRQKEKEEIMERGFSLINSNVIFKQHILKVDMSKALIKLIATSPLPKRDC